MHKHLVAVDMTHLLVVYNTKNILVHVRGHISPHKLLDSEMFMIRFQKLNTFSSGDLLKEICYINMLRFYIPA